MPIGKPLPTNAAVISVASSLSTPSYQTVGLVTGWDTDVAEDLNEIDVLGQTDPVQNLGREKMHFTVNALLADSTDSGQQVIEGAKAARAQIKVQLLWDGTNGWNATALCTGRKSTGKAGNGWVEAQFMFTIVPSSMTKVLAGPII